MSTPGVAVVTLATSGADALARTTASVRWARERVVLDPTGRLRAQAVPGDVDRVVGAGDLSAAAGAEWVLLLREGETVPAPLAAEIQTAIAGVEPAPAYRIGFSVALFGAVLCPRGAAVRLVRRPLARLGVDRGLGITAGTLSAGSGALAHPIERPPLDTLATVLGRIDAEATLLASLMEAAGSERRSVHLIAAPFAVAWRTFTGRAHTRLGWARWIGAVVEGYALQVACAKLWERRNLREVAPS